MDEACHGPEISHVGDQREFYGDRASTGKHAKKAAKELSKSIAKEEASAATGSGVVGENHETG